MKTVEVKPSPLRGCVTPPPSKSLLHRALICAALAQGESVVKNVRLCADTAATLGALRALGAELSLDGDTVRVRGGLKSGEARISCGESGSTLRFLLPVAAALGGEYEFVSDGSLVGRPVSELLEALSAHGVSVKTRGESIFISGRLSTGRFLLPGDVSSQYISGLLLALPMVGGGEIELTSRLLSAPYVRMTASVLQAFGVSSERTDFGFRVSGGGYCSAEFMTENDMSQAALFFGANALGADIRIAGVSGVKMQGDAAAAELFSRLGCVHELENGEYVCKSRSLYTNGRIELDVSDTPDLVPILAVVSAFSGGLTVFGEGVNLRGKESNRLYTVAEAINALGGCARVENGSLSVLGTGGLRGGHFNAHGDHRLMTAFCVAGAFSSLGVNAENADCVGKSYPDFYSDFADIGGIANVVDDGKKH